MKNLLILTIVAGSAIYLLNDNSSGGFSLEGEWTENGRLTVQSMIDGGKNIPEDKVSEMASFLNDATLIVTKNTLDISFKSDPDFNRKPIPYEIVMIGDSSVTISFEKTPGQYTQNTYHFTPDGQCIFMKLKQHNDYWCKAI